MRERCTLSIPGVQLQSWDLSAPPVAHSSPVAALRAAHFDHRKPLDHQVVSDTRIEFVGPARFVTVESDAVQVATRLSGDANHHNAIFCNILAVRLMPLAR